MVSRLLKYSSLLIFYCVFFSQLNIVFAAKSPYLKDMELANLDFSIYENINPNLLIYPLKRITEEIKLRFLLSKEEKKKYMHSLYEVRLRELVYIINNKKEGFLLFTADRYNSFVGKMKTEYPVDTNSKVKFQKRIKLLERLRDIYPANSLYWDKIQQTIDTTRSLI